MLYSDALCIAANDELAMQHQLEITAELPDLLYYTTFPPLPCSPRPASTPTPRLASMPTQNLQQLQDLHQHLQDGVMLTSIQNLI